jgi:hypothetical protein
LSVSHFIFRFIFSTAYEAAEKSPLPIATVLQRLKQSVDCAVLTARLEAAPFQNQAAGRVFPQPVNAVGCSLTPLRGFERRTLFQ